MGLARPQYLHGGEFAMPGQRTENAVTQLAKRKARNLVDRVIHLIREVNGLNEQARP